MVSLFIVAVTEFMGLIVVDLKWINMTRRPVMPASDRGVNEVTKNGRYAIINIDVNEGGYPALTLPA